MEPNQGINTCVPTEPDLDLEDVKLADLTTLPIPEFQAVRRSLLARESTLAEVREILDRDSTKAGSQESEQASILNAAEYVMREIVPKVTFQNRIGCELEGCLLDIQNYRVVGVAAEILGILNDPEIKRELGSWQFEFNFQPLVLEGNALRRLETEQRNKLKTIEEEAVKSGGIPLLVGIPPTLESTDLAASGLTVGPRFTRLEGAWQRAFLAECLRNGTVPSLNGFVPESINVSSSMASVQFHMELPVDPELAARRFNAILFITPFVLAASTGSPFLMEGRGEWAEERIRIWRDLDDLNRGRVFYEKDWIRRSPVEVLERYSQIAKLRLAEKEPDRALDIFKAHTGTTWPFLRLIVDPDNWRVENRVFSAQCPVDNVATMALYYGAVMALEQEPKFLEVLADLPFAKCDENFYSAAKDGLKARLWVASDRQVEAGEYLRNYVLPRAFDGLVQGGIDREDIVRYLGIVGSRVSQSRTVTDWLRYVTECLPGDQATKQRDIARRLVTNQQSGLPSCEWPEWGEL